MEQNITNIDFSKGDGIVPVIVQDANTNEVLTLAYSNKESLERTLSTGNSWFWSRSRKKLWMKGEESGNTQKVRKVLKISKEPVSLEKQVGDEEDSNLGNFIEDQNALMPLDQAIRSNLNEATTKILATLTPREERVLRMRFGIGMNTDHTLEEVGLQFSVTRERIRQIEAKALRKLKHPSRSKHLKSFLEK